jgi:hypothetical protein
MTVKRVAFVVLFLMATWVLGIVLAILAFERQEHRGLETW